MALPRPGDVCFSRTAEKVVMDGLRDVAWSTDCAIVQRGVLHSCYEADAFLLE